MLLVLAALLSFQPIDANLPKTGMWRHGFAVADMNGDTRPDLVFTSRRKAPGPPVIFLNDGAARFTFWSQARFPAMHLDYGAVAAADFDGNGAMDLAVASHYRGVNVLLNDGRGTFSAATGGFAYPSTFSSRAVTVLDWNGDGRLDVAALSDGPRPGSGVQLGVTVFENLGASWNVTRASDDVIFGDAIAAGEVDGDRLPDLLTASQNVRDSRVLRLGSDGGLARRAIQTLVPPAAVSAVEMADFDNDGRDEIIIGYVGGSPSVQRLELLSFPAGSRPAVALWSATGVPVSSLAAGDLDGDGAIDLVAALLDGSLLTFRGDGRGSLTRDADIEVPAWRRGCEAYAVRVADLDGDRRAEIVATFASESCPSAGGMEVLRAVSPKGDRRRAIRH